MQDLAGRLRPLFCGVADASDGARELEASGVPSSNDGFDPGVEGHLVLADDGVFRLAFLAASKFPPSLE